MKHLRKIFENKDRSDLKAIHDILLEIDENENYIVHIISAKGWHYDRERFSELIEDSNEITRTNFFKRYSTSSNKTFSFEIYFKNSIDILNLIDVLSELKTELGRLEDIEFFISGFEIYDDKNNDLYSIGGISFILAKS